MPQLTVDLTPDEYADLLAWLRDRNNHRESLRPCLQAVLREIPDVPELEVGDVILAYYIKSDGTLFSDPSTLRAGEVVIAVTDGAVHTAWISPAGLDADEPRCEDVAGIDSYGIGSYRFTKIGTLTQGIDL